MRSYSMHIEEALSNSHTSKIFAEPLPQEIVGRVVINEKAKVWLDKRYHHLLDPKTFKSNCYVAVPEKNAQRAFDTPTDWERAVAIELGAFPYKTYVGGVYMGKGGLRWGRSYMSTDVKFDPWGFFGHQDAEFETRCSNALLESGGRAGLALGYAFIKPDEYMYYINQKFEDYPDVRKVLIAGLDLVRTNGDQPVYFQRITGVRTRIHHAHVSLNEHAFNAELKSVSSNLLLESKLFSSAFKLHYLQDRIGLSQVQRVLSELIAGNKLNEADLRVYLTLIGGIVSQDIRSATHMVEKNVGNMGSYARLLNQLSAPKDICMGLFHVDFEAVRKDRRNYYFQRQKIKRECSEYAFSLRSKINPYLTYLSQKVFSGPSEDASQMLNELLPSIQ